MAGKLTFEEIKKVLNFDKKIKEKYKKINFEIFIETGTHYGSTIFNMSSYFKELHTIELSKNFYNLCVEKASNEKINNITFYNGSSDIIIKEICEKIKKPAIFFLDSHWSMDNTARGDVDVPLLEELKSIKNRNENDILIIDDLRLFGSKNPNDVNWEAVTIDSIMETLKKNVFATMIYNDRFIVFLKKIV